MSLTRSPCCHQLCFSNAVIVGGAVLFSTSKLKRMALHCRAEEQSVKPKL